MTEKIGHTAIAVLQGRRQFSKGGLNWYDIDVDYPGEGPAGESFFEGVNRIIARNEGKPVSLTEFSQAQAAGLASGENPVLAGLIAERSGVPLTRVKKLLSKMRQEKTISRGLLARKSADKIQSPYAPKTSENYYATLAVKMRQKLRQEHKTLPESETA